MKNEINYDFSKGTDAGKITKNGLQMNVGDTAIIKLPEAQAGNIWKIMPVPKDNFDVYLIQPMFSTTGELTDGKVTDGAQTPTLKFVAKKASTFDFQILQGVPWYEDKFADVPITHRF